MTLRRTHGEQWLINKQKFYKYSKSVDECSSIDKGLPKRMQKKDILSYYNKKLHLYWISIGLRQHIKEHSMPPNSNIQVRFDSLKDDEVLNITKAQLISLVEKVKHQAMKDFQEANLFNADDVINALKAS